MLKIETGTNKVLFHFLVIRGTVLACIFLGKTRRMGVLTHSLSYRQHNRENQDEADHHNTRKSQDKTIPRQETSSNTTDTNTDCLALLCVHVLVFVLVCASLVM